MQNKRGIEYRKIHTEPIDNYIELHQEIRERNNKILQAQREKQEQEKKEKELEEEIQKKVEEAITKAIDKVLKNLL